MATLYAIREGPWGMDEIQTQGLNLGNRTVGCVEPQSPFYAGEAKANL